MQHKWERHVAFSQCTVMCVWILLLSTSSVCSVAEQQWKTATAVTTFSRGIRRFRDFLDIWGIHSSKTGNFLPKLRSVWNKLPKKSLCECRSGIFTLNINMDHLRLQTFLIIVIVLARGSSWSWSLRAALFAYMLTSSFLCLFGKSLFSTLCLSFPCAAVRIKNAFGWPK